MTWQARGSAKGQTSGRGPGFPVTPPVPDVAGVQFWAKPLGVGKTAVLFINGGKQPYLTASVKLAELNITASTATVTDVWTGNDAGAVVAGSWSPGVVSALDSKFVVMEY